MSNRRSWLLTAWVLGIAPWVAAAPPSTGNDWPQWGGSDGRNMAASMAGLPSWCSPGGKTSDGSDVDLRTTKNVKWVAKLGSLNYSTPAVAGGRVYVGTNDMRLNDDRHQPTGGGLLLCLDEATGKPLWQFVSPKLDNAQERVSEAFETMALGICSTPTVDGDRVYLVTNRCEVVCLDAKGPADNAKGQTDNVAGAGLPDARVLWKFDIIKDAPSYPHDAANSSVLVHGDLLYVGTSNGTNDNFIPLPKAPSLIVLDKKTGRLVGKDDGRCSSGVFHGQWSSPSLGKVGDKTLVFFGGGDGVCYAFEALESVPEQPVVLKTVWTFDCNPPEYRVQGGKPIEYFAGDIRKHPENKDDGSVIAPSEIIATPVFHDGRVYVATGRDPLHGRGKGMLYCIDASQTGDITKTGKVWSYEFERTLSTVSIAGDLLFVADFPGRIHCLDLKTGQPHWVHETKCDSWSSTFVADGKVYLGTRKSLWVLAASKEKKVLANISLQGSQIRSTPVAANGVLYVATQRFLWALQGSYPNPADAHSQQAGVSVPAAVSNRP